jgi:hypothetical protein
MDRRVEDRSGGEIDLDLNPLVGQILRKQCIGFA